MKITRTRGIVGSILAVLLVAALVYTGIRVTRTPTSVQVQLHPEGFRDAYITQDERGQVVYKLKADSGEWVFMQPDQFAQDVWDTTQQRDTTQRWFLTLLNVSSTSTIGWVLLGLVGQIVFAGRMIVQWLASEKARASVIPEAFWWMALVGASMLLLYFIWRKDIVGVLGQGFGWLIYTRNLYFIYRRRFEKPEPDTLPEPPVAPEAETEPAPTAN